MTKPQSQRKIKKNLFFSKLHLHGHTLKSLGKALTPPVTKNRVHQIIYGGCPEYRLKEISAILGSNIQTLFPKDVSDATT